LGRSTLAVFLAAALCSLGVCRAEDEGDSDAAQAVRLQGNLGLTGFMDMVDARTPGLLSIRGGSRYELFVRDRNFETATGTLVREERRHEIWTHVGLSLLGFIDASARIPFVWDRQTNDIRGGPNQRDNDQGWGDLDLAAKISLEMGPFTVAPYAWGRLPTGEPAVEELAELNYGAAATFSILNSYVSFHGNLAGVQKETGISALRYRLGFAFSPWASDSFLLRVFAYADGIEFEGSGGSDLDAEFGLQLILFETLTAELGAGLRIMDSDQIDDTLKRQLRGIDGTTLQRHVEEDGTWTIQLAVGTSF
jgi:hypothetical protein